MAERRLFIVTFKARNDVEFRAECSGLAEMVRAASSASTLIKRQPPFPALNDVEKTFNLLKHFEERNYSRYEFDGIAVRELGES